MKTVSGDRFVNQPAAVLDRPSIFPRMQYANVPVVDARYWTGISLASVFGCNMGDFVSLYLHWGHWLGLFPLAIIFAALIAGERRSARTTQVWYWAVVIVLRTAATNVADLATHTFGWPYPWVIASLAMIQVLESSCQFHSGYPRQEPIELDVLRRTAGTGHLCLPPAHWAPPSATAWPKSCILAPEAALWR